MKTPSSSKSRTAFSFFRAHQKGNVSMLLGLLIVPLMLSIGFAIDFLRVTNYRSKAAETLDTALLMTAQKYAYDKTINVTAAAQGFMDDIWHSNNPAPTVIASADSTTNNITGTIASSLPTTFMRVMGMETMKINIRAEVTANTKNLELVMVLDNTGSMNVNNKIGTLRTAATDLIETVMPDNAAEANIKIGVVPFARYVNVGLDKAGESWLDVPADYNGTWRELTDPSQCSSQGTPGTPTTCTDGEGQTYNCTTGGSGPSSCPDSAYTTHNYTNTWKGCVGSRATPLNTEDDNYSVKIPGVLNPWPEKCPAKLTELTTNKADVLSGIASMSGSNIAGKTYIPSGLMWGWRVLSKTAPFDQAEPYTSSTAIKVMVLMTDGENTVYPTFPRHENAGDTRTKPYDASTVANITISNGITATACANIKAKGILLYSVAFAVTDPTIKTILEACATSPSNYYDATDASSLSSAFKDITRELINLRVAK